MKLSHVNFEQVAENSFNLKFLIENIAFFVNNRVNAIWIKELVEQLKDAATKTGEALEEYMFFFWQGDKFIPQYVSSLIVEFTAPEISITELEFIVRRLFELRRYIGYWSSDRKSYIQLCP